jgi:hypothetical protein
MGQCLEFFVLSGLELLELEPLDGGSAGFRIELDLFDAQLRLAEGIVGSRDSGFISGKLGLGTGLILRKLFEVFRQCQEAAVTVLQNQERADFIKHPFG